jgi:hypothetical protein
VGLAIFLFCCTGGIGFIIYLIIYFTQPEDICVFCNQKTVPYTGQQVIQTSNTPYGQPQTSTSPPKVETEQTLKYCPNCGAKIIEETKFCEFCGIEIGK